MIAKYFYDGIIVACMINNADSANPRDVIRLKLFCERHDGKYHESRGMYNYNTCNLT